MKCWLCVSLEVSELSDHSSIVILACGVKSIAQIIRRLWAEDYNCMYDLFWCHLQTNDTYLDCVLHYNRCIP